MVPYSSLLFFYILILALILAAILGVFGKSIKIYGMIINIFILFIIFYNSLQQVIYLVFFVIWGFLLIESCLFLRRRSLVGFRRTFLQSIMILLSLLPLAFVKFGNVLLHQTVIGFLGISYLTFKIIQMLVEIYDNLIDKVNLFDYLYFLLFFPTISSGPIDRSRRFKSDTINIPSRKEYIEILGEGIWKIFKGAGYKFILAYLISSYWMDKIPPAHNLMNTLSYMYAYSLYLFFDFAGYSLIAIGVSYILGIKTPENFNKPFISQDIKEFWTRWHMTLSFWFRDFIYTRIVMNALKNKRLKKFKYVSSYAGYFITMGLMGLWHGTSVYFILYGLYHGSLIVLTDLFQRKVPWYSKVKNNIAWKCFSIFVTFNLVCFGFLIFSGYLFIKTKS